MKTVKARYLNNNIYFQGMAVKKMARSLVEQINGRFKLGHYQLWQMKLWFITLFGVSFICGKILRNINIYYSTQFNQNFQKSK